jgi:hypothetical protein
MMRRILSRSLDLVLVLCLILLQLPPCRCIASFKQLRHLEFFIPSYKDGMQQGINMELLQNTSNACSSLKLTNKPYLRPTEKISRGKRSSRHQFWFCFLRLLNTFLCLVFIRSVSCTINCWQRLRAGRTRSCVSILGRSKKLSLHRNVQTDSVTHPFFHTGGSSSAGTEIGAGKYRLKIVLKVKMTSQTPSCRKRE